MGTKINNKILSFFNYLLIVLKRNCLCFLAYNSTIVFDSNDLYYSYLTKDTPSELFYLWIIYICLLF